MNLLYLYKVNGLSGLIVTRQIESYEISDAHQFRTRTLPRLCKWTRTLILEIESSLSWVSERKIIDTFHQPLTHSFEMANGALLVQILRTSTRST